MGDFINATYDGQPCLLNMDYVMDIFPEENKYKAYTMDFDRGEYLISREDFNKWQKKAESEIHCNCTDAEIAKSFIEDVEAVKELLLQAESENWDDKRGSNIKMDNTCYKKYLE